MLRDQLGALWSTGSNGTGQRTFSQRHNGGGQ